MKKFLTIMLAVVLTFVVVGCNKDTKKDTDYSEYIGYQFSGKDPWGTELAITIRTLKDDKLTWTYTDALSDITVYNELTTDFKDGKASFNVKGDEETYEYEYSGTLSLKDGNLVVELKSGQLTSKSEAGGSSSHHVGALEDAAKTVTLKKVVDNS